MPASTKSNATAGPATTSATKPPSKSALVLKLLSRARGATIEEMAEPTSWQPHSTRAFLSGLRKKGMIIAREPRKTGETAYRIITASEAAATARAALNVATEAMAAAKTGTPDAATEVAPTPALAPTPEAVA